MQKAFWQAILAELKPFDGRMAMAWRTALVCSLTAGVFMTYQVPLVAIGCYLIMFLAKPNAQENIVVAIAISLLVSLVVLLLLTLTRLAIEIPMWRMVIIVVGSYLFIFIGAASSLGPGGNIVALVIGFVMTLLPYVPFGELATRGILFAWLMVLIPMGVIIVFHGLAGRSANAQLQAILAGRCDLIARALTDCSAARDGDGRAPVHQDKTEDNPNDAILTALRTGQSEPRNLLKLIRLFHLVPRAQSDVLDSAILTSHDLMLLLQDKQTGKTLMTDHPELAAALSHRCRELAQLLEHKDLVKAVTLMRNQPVLTHGCHGKADRLGNTVSLAQTLVRGINGLFDEPNSAAQADTGLRAQALDPKPSSAMTTRKQGFFKADAWSNPEYSRFAIKTTAAAVLCYIIYTSIDWQGIHTAMVTCYVAALGSTGETVHKLALRITGCLIGAAMGIAALVFLMPAMTSISQLMLLVFAGIMIAAWVSSGSERISYAGIQIGLAFLMTVLQDFRPDVELSVASDRIYGILLGNAVLFIMFTRLWPVSVVSSVRRHLDQCVTDLRLLVQRMAEPFSQRKQDEQRHLTEACLKSLNQGREALIYNRFEPYALRAQTARVHAIRDELDALETMTLELARMRVFAAASSGMPETTGKQSNSAVRKALHRISRQIDLLDELNSTSPIDARTADPIQHVAPPKEQA